VVTSPTRLQGLRPFTLRFVNPVTRLVAGWLPGFGILHYRGRKSGRDYRTPMNVFRHGDEYVMALTYGAGVQWVKNIVAAGECRLVTRGKPLTLIEPRLVHDPTRSLMPPVVRQFLGLMHVTDFLRMRISTAGASTEGPLPRS
jgi:deazaflavin-dependent oxidoreductase (nitroreductase family)